MRSTVPGVIWTNYCVFYFSEESLTFLNVGYFQGFNEVHCSQICKAFVFKLAGKVSDAILQGF